MGELWMTGDDLLKTDYQGNKRNFFGAIVRGEIVPHKTYEWADRGDWARIYPSSGHMPNTLGKIAILESLQEKLALDDETLLRSHYRSKFIFSVDADNADEEQFQAFARSEEGLAVREKISTLRPKWKEHSVNLLAEIGGEPVKIQSPSEVWRDVILNESDQKILLEAWYLVDIGQSVSGDQEEGKVMPATGEVVVGLGKIARRLGCSVNTVKNYLGLDPDGYGPGIASFKKIVIREKRGEKTRYSADMDDLDNWKPPAGKKKRKKK